MNHMRALSECEKLVSKIANGEITNPVDEAKKLKERINTVSTYNEYDNREGTELLIKELFSMLNRGQWSEKQFADAFLREHRTLQQDFTREVVIAWVKFMSSVEYYDLRNEASVKLAKEFAKIAEDKAIPMI